MTDEIDTSAEAVERLADYLNTPGQGLVLYDAAATIRALVVERDDERQRAERAEAEKLHLRDVVCESMLQLRWLNEKEQRGTTNTVLARLEHALSQNEGGE